MTEKNKIPKEIMIVEIENDKARFPELNVDVQYSVDKTKYIQLTEEEKLHYKTRIFGEHSGQCNAFWAKKILSIPSLNPFQKRNLYSIDTKGKKEFKVSNKKNIWFKNYSY